MGDFHAADTGVFELTRLKPRTVPAAWAKTVLVIAACIILGAAFFVSRFIWTEYGEGSRGVPVVFLVAEALVAVWAVFRNLSEVGKLRGLLVREEQIIRGLASSGAQLGDSMVYVGDARRDKTGEFQELSATWANFLIVVGMCGTAGYLVYHAGSFVTAGQGDISSSLANLLPLAPKAFAATGFALFCAAILALASGFALRSVEHSAASAEELSKAWEAGLTQLTRHDSDQLTNAFAAALDIRIADKLDDVSKRLESAADASREVASRMEEGAAHAAGLAESAAAAQLKASEHAEVVAHQISSLVAAVAKMCERTIATAAKVAELETRLSESAGEAVAKMDALYKELLKEMSNSAQDFAPEILKSVTERLLEAVKQHINELFTRNTEQTQQIQEASFSEARKRFEEHLGPVSSQVQTLSKDMATLDAALRGVGGILAAAAVQWPQAAERAAGSIHETRGALEALAQAPSPRSLDGVVQAIKVASGALSAVAAELNTAVSKLDGVAEHSRAVGEIRGILRT